MKHPYDSANWPAESARANTIDIVLWVAGLVLFAAVMVGFSRQADKHIRVASNTTCQMTNATQGFCHE